MSWNSAIPQIALLPNRVLPPNLQIGEPPTITPPCDADEINLRLNRFSLNRGGDYNSRGRNKLRLCGKVAGQGEQCDDWSEEFRGPRKRTFGGWQDPIKHDRNDSVLLTVPRLPGQCFELSVEANDRGVSSSYRKDTAEYCYDDATGTWVHANGMNGYTSLWDNNNKFHIEMWTSFERVAECVEYP